MANDGKRLEHLVAFVEGQLGGKGFSVTVNEKVYDDGQQVAELDIVVRGRVGSTDIIWLLECRDRPSAGPAPGSWIEQLVGRRQRHGFNKVTAVSTTGFAPQAIKFATESGIELREVIAAEEFEWLGLSHYSQRVNKVDLVQVRVVGVSETPPELTEALKRKLAEVTTQTKFLRSSTSGKQRSIMELWLFDATSDVVDKIEPGAPAKKIKRTLEYAESDHFIVDTDRGEVHVSRIEFDGTVFATETAKPVDSKLEYRSVMTGESISQVASFSPADLGEVLLALEFHHVAETGQVHVAIRGLTKQQAHSEHQSKKEEEDGTSYSDKHD